MQRVKKMLFISITLLLFLAFLLVLHDAYADKPIISLNAPVSFPVDI